MKKCTEFDDTRSDEWWFIVNPQFVASGPVREVHGVAILYIVAAWCIGNEGIVMSCRFHQRASLHFSSISAEAREIQIECIIDDNLRK